MINVTFFRKQLIKYKLLDLEYSNASMAIYFIPSQPEGFWCILASKNCRDLSNDPVFIILIQKRRSMFHKFNTKLVNI